MDLLERGGFGVRVGLLAHKGDIVKTHAHNFDHLTYVLGRARVRVLEPTGYDADGQPTGFAVVRTRVFTVPGHAWIAAGVWHEIEADEDHVPYECVYLSRTPDGDLSENYTGWMPGYV